MSKEKQIMHQNETVHYGRVPKEILETMTPEVRRQYFLWDEIFKREIELYPWLLTPLIKEIFGKEYPSGTKIKLLSTEYVVSKVHEQGQKLIESIRSDLLVQVGNRDIYHMECQMKQGGNIAVRMLEYDMNISMIHGLEWEDAEDKKQGRRYKLNFPQSAILYLDNTKNTPDTESCIVRYPDGTEYEYCVPVLKVQEYTPQMIMEKNLYLLFPFLPIRFRDRFEKILKKKNDSEVSEKMEIWIKENSETLKKDLTKFITDCIIIINREEENGTLNHRRVHSPMLASLQTFS